MMIPDIFLTMSQTVETPSFFPFPLSMQIIFTVVSVAFLIYRFVTNKKPYQLIMAIAILIALLLRIPNSSRTLFYVVGLIELILIVIAFITSLIFRDKSEPVQETPENTETDEVNE